MSEKLYTAADLEQARANERARCIESIYAKVKLGSTPDPMRSETRYKCLRAITDLGPIGETEEKMDRR